MIKVLIVDDSALVRQILSSYLQKYTHIHVCGVAEDPYQARDLIVKHRPDVMTLDVEMPRMNGLEFLKRLMPQFPLPTIMVSSLTQRGSEVTLNALRLGAFDYITKPSSNVSSGLESMIKVLVQKIDVAYTNREKIKQNISRMGKIDSEHITAVKKTTDKIILIGASTGGTEALSKIVKQVPEDFPGIVIVQHMPPLFTKSFSERLNRESKMIVKEAEDNDRIIQGRILIAEGSKQLRIKRDGAHYSVVVGEQDLISGHCPSVDALFESAAQEVKENAIGVILTGMGKDGASGLYKLRISGATTIAQDEESCVVYGMPRVAKEMGAVQYTKPLQSIFPFIKSLLKTV